MAHVLLNQVREHNPNRNISSISTLSVHDAATAEDSRQLLLALAAQVKPVMDSHGMTVRNFDELAFNTVFAGRSWNKGEKLGEHRSATPPLTALPQSEYRDSATRSLKHTVPNFVAARSLVPSAHIKHVNHGFDFQLLCEQLRLEVGQLQSEGYYGDGPWSSGRRLLDAEHNSDASPLPEYICGGAHIGKPPASVPRTAASPPSSAPSITRTVSQVTLAQAGSAYRKSGSQCPKRRKAGSRVTAKNAFQGTGHTLNEDASDEEEMKKGAGFRKQAGSKKAREERAAAVERRVQALLGNAGPSSTGSNEQLQDGEQNTDEDRRRAMLDAVPESDLGMLKSSQNSFTDDFFLPSSSEPEAGTSHLEIPVKSEDMSYDVQIVTRPPSPIKTRRGKRPVPDDEVAVTSQSITSSSRPTKKRKAVSYGSIVTSEVEFRKKEALGLAGSSASRQLGSAPRSLSPESQDGDGSIADGDVLDLTGDFS
ncbi:hypothetical protein EIP91_009012 [Steccherinum ochraceum]|uniref:WLM domain-containing protein n=1 Tax=Steccherinum ochraceum TaxID=92696 RepID=A0A4R0R4H6_9APHY|nr:hypothetical protein EIP91_009012 [Steccherinum ochraceum]